MIYKKSFFLTFILPFYFALCSAQISGVILDKSSRKPVPYVNIWIEGEQIGVSSEENGTFLINVKAADYAKKYLSISSVGYLKGRSLITNAQMIVELTPTNQLLNEVFLFSAKNTLRKKIGLLNRNQIGRWWGTVSPVIIARFYPYDEIFKTLPFLREVILVTDSKINTAQFRLRLFEVSDSGGPGNDLVEPLFGYAKKGRNYVTMDVTDRNFKVPENGFFVAFEWLILDRNKSYIKTWKGHTDKKIKLIGYEPSVGSNLPGKNSKNWVYESGTWKNTQNRWDGQKLTENLAVEDLLFQLVLSN